MFFQAWRNSTCWNRCHTHLTLFLESCHNPIVCKQLCQHLYPSRRHKLVYRPHTRSLALLSPLQSILLKRLKIKRSYRINKIYWFFPLFNISWKSETQNQKLILCLKGKKLREKKLVRKKEVQNIFVRIWPQSALLNSTNIYSRSVNRTNKCLKFNFF